MDSSLTVLEWGLLLATTVLMVAIPFSADSKPKKRTNAGFGFTIIGTILIRNTPPDTPIVTALVGIALLGSTVVWVHYTLVEYDGYTVLTPN